MILFILYTPTLLGIFLAQRSILSAPSPVQDLPPALLAENATLRELTTRLDNMTASVQQAQLALDTLAFKLAKVEGVTDQSRINVANAINTLQQVNAAASLNRNSSLALENRTGDISTRVTNQTHTLAQLSTRLSVMEQNAKILGSDAKKVAEKVSAMEKSIKEGMPGGDISDRLKALQEKLSLFEKKLKEGINDEVKKDMEKLMDNIRSAVNKLSSKMEEGEWRPAKEVE